MDSEAEFDEFLMTVVESALTRPAGEREKYLKSACAGNVLMYQQAKERVEWEERMGEFLEEPLIRRTPAVEEPVEVAQTKRKTPKLPLFALASVLLMALAWFALRPHSTNTVRLAIVAQNVNLFAFVLDIKDRLRGMRSQFEVSEFEPGATHVLRIEFRDPIAKVTLKDLAADRELFRLEKQLSAAQLSDWVSSVSAAVGKEFGFKVEAGVSDLAYLNYWQGLECLHAGPQEKAISDFSKAMAHDPQAVQLSVAMGHAQLRMFQKGDGREWLDKAGLSLSKAKSLRSSYYPAFVVSGRYQMAYGNFEQAVTEFSEAVRLVPTDEEGWQGLAEAHLAAHQEELAMATYQKAIDQQPESVWPYFLRGYYFEKQKRFAEAERDYKVICRLVPGWTDGQDQLKRVQKLLHPN